jgi:GT2 family glycosyltransferase
MATLALQLLTFHEKPEILALLFDSLRKQTDQDWTLYWLDNASTAEERAAFRAVSFPYVMIESDENLGFAGGHEDLYRRHSADYVFCVNADAILEPHYIERLRKYLDAHSECASVAGAIFRWSFDAQRRIQKTEIVDSLGLGKTRYHKVYDIGSGQSFSSTILPTSGLFGVSGCLPIYRRAAVGSSLFDSSYFLYKEDVDLAYRLHNVGWTSALVPGARAYHYRTFRASFFHGDVSFANQWRSYRNHWRNLRKHLTWKDWFRDGWAIFPFEFAKACFITFQYAIRRRDHHG